MSKLPEIGQTYHFFDDGKIKPWRHYMATVKRVLPWVRTPRKIRRAFKKFAKETDWLFNKKTKYFVFCDIPKYDENEIIFAQTKDGTWYSFDYSNGWQSGRLDIDGSMYQILLYTYGVEL